MDKYCRTCGAWPPLSPRVIVSEAVCDILRDRVCADDIRYCDISRDEQITGYYAKDNQNKNYQEYSFHASESYGPGN
jgi:hypothetical protein